MRWQRLLVKSLFTMVLFMFSSAAYAETQLISTMEQRSANGEYTIISKSKNGKIWKIEKKLLAMNFQTKGFYSFGGQTALIKSTNNGIKLNLTITKDSEESKKYCQFDYSYSLIGRTKKYTYEVLDIGSTNMCNTPVAVLIVRTRLNPQFLHQPKRQNKVRVVNTFHYDRIFMELTKSQRVAYYFEPETRDKSGIPVDFPNWFENVHYTCKDHFISFN